MNEISFKLSSEFIELYKLLKLTGVAESGGSAKHLISEGGVKVNGAVETRKAFKVRPGHVIELSDCLIRV